MASREMELAALPQASDPPRGLLSAILGRLTDPFRRGVPPETRPPTGFFTDTTVCIGCKACEVACKEWNQLAADGFHWSGNSYDNTETLSATSWRHVKFIEQFPPDNSALQVVAHDFNHSDTEFSLESLLNEPKEGRWLMMSDVCKHCVTAPCQQACPTGAIIHTEFENVFIQPDICNGCSSCVSACPFGVITRSGVDGHSHKCTLCYDRQRDGLVPACAKACPTQSIQFGPIDELRERARTRVEDLHSRGVATAYLYGDTPSKSYSELNSFYLLVDRPSVYGLPDNPFNPWLHMKGDYVRAIASGLAAVAALLAVLFLFWGTEMQTELSPQIGNSGYASGPVTKAPAWHGLVAWDMLFNGMTTGLFLVAAISELAAPGIFASVAKTAYPVALVLLLIDLLCLVFDLGDPLRFHHMLRVFKPGSPMSLGTWCLTIYSLPLTVAAAMSLLPGGWITLEWVRRLAVIVGLLPALGSAVYKGVLLSTNAQPGWKDARWLGGYLTNSALMLGCAEMLVIAVLMKHASAAAILRPALGLLLVLNLLPLCLLVFDLRTTLSRIYTRPELYGLGALSIGGGVLIPLFLLLVMGSIIFTLSAVMFILLGSLVIRFVIVKLPHASA